MNKYEKLRQNLLQFFMKYFQQFLQIPTAFYFHEIYFFDDIDIQNHIIGVHRAAIHTALNEPHSYLQVKLFIIIFFSYYKSDCCSVPVAKFQTNLKYCELCQIFV